jgi:hypothetical protein
MILLVSKIVHMSLCDFVVAFVPVTSLLPITLVNKMETMTFCTV